MTAPRPLDGLTQLEDVGEIVMPHARSPRRLRLRLTFFFPTREQH